MNITKHKGKIFGWIPSNTSCKAVVITFGCSVVTPLASVTYSVPSTVKAKPVFKETQEAVNTPNTIKPNTEPAVEIFSMMLDERNVVNIVVPALYPYTNVK